MLPPAVRRIALDEPWWEADIVPIPTALEDDAAARPGSVLIGVGGLILYQDLLVRAPAEPPEIAARLAQAVEATSGEVGRLPEGVLVRHDSTARALRPLLEERGVQVRKGAMPAFLDTARDMVTTVVDDTAWPPASVLRTWAGWGLPNSMVRDLFEAAADFHARAPWRLVENRQRRTTSSSC